ncbi:MAG: hypothetical protein NTW28_10175 [Candidatus Solibacter sp.]|nr:hypothetical protein [Candidatus Solibacter sp.]
MKHILLLTLAAISLTAADATGKWTGTMTVPTPNGDEQRPAFLVLKQEGPKLTGTAGPDANEQHALENGKAESGTLTFQLSAGDSIMKFTLKHEGDEIKGEISRDRDGQTQTAKLAVRRDK